MIAQHIYVYDTDGRIVSFGTASEDEFEFYEVDGRKVGVGIATSATHYVDVTTDDLKEYTPEQAAAKAARPAYSARWDIPTMAWVDLRDLEALKADKWEALKAARTAAFDAPLPTPWGTFDSDSAGRDSIKEAVQLAMYLVTQDPEAPLRYTLADNSRPTLTASNIIQVGLLLGQKIQAAYDISDQLRSQLDAASTGAEVEGIQWPS